MRESTGLVGNVLGLASDGLRMVRTRLELSPHLKEIDLSGREGVEAGLEVLDAPDRYVAGEETALINWLNGADAKSYGRANANAAGIVPPSASVVSVVSAA